MYDVFSKTSLGRTHQRAYGWQIFGLGPFLVAGSLLSSWLSWSSLSWKCPRNGAWNKPKPSILFLFAAIILWQLRSLTCVLLCTHLQIVFEIQFAYVRLLHKHQYSVATTEELERRARFQTISNRFGFSRRGANELWKWYDSSNRKGAASFPSFQILKLGLNC